jgi:hypothetical protein
MYYNPVKYWVKSESQLKAAFVIMSWLVRLVAYIKSGDS